MTEHLRTLANVRLPGDTLIPDSYFTPLHGHPTGAVLCLARGVLAHRATLIRFKLPVSHFVRARYPRPSATPFPPAPSPVSPCEGYPLFTEPPKIHNPTTITTITTITRQPDKPQTTQTHPTNPKTTTRQPHKRRRPD